MAHMINACFSNSLWSVPAVMPKPPHVKTVVLLSGLWNLNFFTAECEADDLIFWGYAVNHIIATWVSLLHQLTNWCRVENNDVIGWPQTTVCETRDRVLLCLFWKPHSTVELGGRLFLSKNRRLHRALFLLSSVMFNKTFLFLKASKPLLSPGTHEHLDTNTTQPRAALPNTCTATLRCLQETPSPVALVFSPQGPAGIEATSLSSSPVCVCSCRTCPVHARTASISCLSESAGGPWAGRAAECSLYGQERVKPPHSWVQRL